MAMTNLQANWDAVKFPDNLTVLNKIQDVTFRKGGQVSLYGADMDRIATTGQVFMSAPTAKIMSGNPAQFMGIAAGTTGTLLATHKDAKLATGGDILYTLANAIFEDAQTNGAHGSWGACSADFKAISSDGVTHPLSFTRA